jgi:hypothetical protein
MIRVNKVNPGPLLKMTAGGAITKGALCVSSSGAAVEAAADVTTQIIVGVAAEDCDSGAVVTLYPLNGTLLEIDVDTTGTATTFADTDIGYDFDISVSSHDFFIDPDDTTGPLILQGYDNDRGTATVIVPNTFIQMM